MRASVLVACLVVLVGAGYVYRLQQKAERDVLRQKTLAKIATIDGAIKASQTEQIRQQYSDGDYDERMAVVRRERSKILAAVKEFVDIESELKKENEGVIPQWLRDDRTWQSLDKEFSR